MLVHNIFNISLTKFGQMDVKGVILLIFFPSNLEWSVISQNLRGEFNYAIIFNVKNVK